MCIYRLISLSVLYGTMFSSLRATTSTQDLVTEKTVDQRVIRQAEATELFKNIVVEQSEKESQFITKNAKVTAYSPNDLFTKSIALEAPLLLAPEERSKKERDLLRRELRKVTRRKAVRQMSEDDLRTAATISEQLQDYEESLTYLKQLMKVTKSSTVVQKVTLEIADVTFLEGNVKGAAELYSKYAMTYPGDKQRAAYAEYLSLIAHNSLRGTDDRDQTATMKTIALADAFLERQNSFSRFYQEGVLAIKHDCVNQLFKHAEVVFDHYTTQKRFKAAENRLTSMKTQFLAMRPDLAPNILECDIRLAYARKDTLRVAELTNDLQTKFPGYVEKRIVAEQTPRRAYVNRF